jgi:hypothetical protein
MNSELEQLRDEARKVFSAESKARLAYEKKKRDRWLLYVGEGDTVQLAWQKAARDVEDLELKFEVANVERLALWYLVGRSRLGEDARIAGI